MLKYKLVKYKVSQGNESPTSTCTCTASQQEGAHKNVHYRAELENYYYECVYGRISSGSNMDP